MTSNYTLLILTENSENELQESFKTLGSMDEIKLTETVRKFEKQLDNIKYMFFINEKDVTKSYQFVLNQNNKALVHFNLEDDSILSKLIKDSWNNREKDSGKPEYTIRAMFYLEEIDEFEAENQIIDSLENFVNDGEDFEIFSLDLVEEGSICIFNVEMRFTLNKIKSNQELFDNLELAFLQSPNSFTEFESFKILDIVENNTQKDISDIKTGDRIIGSSVKVNYSEKSINEMDDEQIKAEYELGEDYFTSWTWASIKKRVEVPGVIDLFPDVVVDDSKINGDLVHISLEDIEKMDYGEVLKEKDVGENFYTPDTWLNLKNRYMSFVEEQDTFISDAEYTETFQIQFNLDNTEAKIKEDRTGIISEWLPIEYSTDLESSSVTYNGKIIPFEL